MKLQILVPQYKETDEVIKPLLDSLMIQRSVDFNELGVIICNDGSDVFLTEEFLNSYPFKIEYYKCEHAGVSATRNACFERATADYVMFCDADDMFFTQCALWIIFREIDNNGGFDSLVSCFVEESHHPETGEVNYINHEMDSTFVHGKVHNRKYLLKNQIKWNPNLTIHEDSYFNILCQNCSENVKYCPTPFYLWCWRDESVCRHDPKYILKTYNNLIDSNEALIGEFVKRGKLDKVMFFTAFLIWDAYYTMCKPEWVNQENKEYKYKTELRFKEYYHKHKNEWNTIPLQDKMQISNMVRTRSVQEGMLVEGITIEDWLKKISKLK